MHTLLSTIDGTINSRSDITQALFGNQTINPDSWLSILFALLMAFAIGMFVFWIYRMSYRGVMYNPNFGLTLVLMTIVTTPVVMCIRNNLALSMGMVGALSIVRFRTAVKDPLDTAYMFWALTMGILIGAGQIFLGALAAVGIGVLILVLTKFKFKQANTYLLVIHYIPGAEQAIQSVLKGVRTQKIKSRTVSRGGAEMTVEMRIEKQGQLLSKISSIDGVQDATLVAYQPE